MPATLTSDTRRRVAFGNALAEAMRVRRLTQTELGDQLDSMRQSSISAWRKGDTLPPNVETVFKIERALRLRPGHLSHHLGFVPADEVYDLVSVRDAIMADELLDETGRRILLNVYNDLTSPGGAPRRVTRKLTRRR